MKSKSKIVSIILVMAVILGTFMMGFNVYAAALGDVTSDGEINSTDALVILKHSVGIEMTASAQAVADVNGDGKINATDALLILQYSVGLIKKFPAQNQETGYAATTTDNVNFRKGPATSYGTYGTIPKGTTIYVESESNGWAKVTYNGNTGWVSLTYVLRSNLSGYFVFTIYGNGHGVGMSQLGAIEYAKQGWTYDKILLHYYYHSDMKLLTDTSMPSTVKYKGEDVSLKKFMLCTMAAEMSASHPAEALKAQAVAIYTYAKSRNFTNMSAGDVAYKEGNYAGTSFEKALDAVWGKYLSLNGRAIEAVFCASMGGKNCASSNTWGGSDSPYLKGGRVSPENVVNTTAIPAKTIKETAKSKWGITLSGDPSTWITNVVHDSSISSSVGYIDSMKLGGTSLKGVAFSNAFFPTGMRCHCFSFKYVA